MDFSNSSESDIFTISREMGVTSKDKILPEKSKILYEKAYTNFINWCESKHIKQYTEYVLLSYFGEISEKYKASTLWTCYSKIKSTLLINKKVDIGKYSKLIPFLRRKSHGYASKKSRILSREQIQKFIREAPDDIYLVTKVSYT